MQGWLQENPSEGGEAGERGEEGEETPTAAASPSLGALIQPGKHKQRPIASTRSLLSLGSLTGRTLT